MNVIKKRSASELRCPSCGALLGIRDAAGFNIKRGDTQATVSGDFQLSLVCWRHGCRKLMVLQIDTRRAPRPPAAE